MNSDAVVAPDLDRRLSAPAMLPALAHVRNWVFDLDNTLYPATSDLFGQVDARMTAFVGDLLGVEADEARRIQKQHFHEHGTTLSGLMRTHGVDPHAFLAYVHDIRMEVLAEDKRLVRLIAALPGRKLVFTNGDEPYARRVLDRLGLGGSFERIHDIHACAYQPKPHAAAYRSMTEAFAIDAAESLFADDMARNLAPAKAIGMTTLWVDNGSEQAGASASNDFVDHRTADLGDWLEHILEERA